MEKLKLWGNLSAQIKIECGITVNSAHMIQENLKDYKNMKEMDLGSKTEDKVDNKIEDYGCTAILSNAKYLTNLEEMYLYSRYQNLK